MRISKNQKILLAAVVTILIVCAFFMSRVRLPDWAHYVSALNIILFSIPSLYVLRWWLGIKKGILVFIILGLFAITIETVGIKTGFPYGNFEYSDLLGFKLFGVVPWTLLFAWTPLMLGAYSIAANLSESPAVRISTTPIILTLVDAVLDPAAVWLGFWKYFGPQFFYGVPLSNFLGWLLSSLVGTLILELLLKGNKGFLPVPVSLSSSLFLILIFWTSFNLFASLFAPAFIGITLIVLILVLWKKRFYSFDDFIVFVDERNSPLAVGAKLESHNESTELHSAFSVFVFNSKKELLLQKRALTKKTWPGVWSNSCCGHVRLHETAYNAARRRLKQELCINPEKLELALPNFKYRAVKDSIVENEICPVFVALYDGRVKPNPEEVAEVRWIDWKEFTSSVLSEANFISPWARLETEELLKSEDFTKFFENIKPGQHSENKSI